MYFATVIMAIDGIRSNYIPGEYKNTPTEYINVSLALFLV